VEAAITKAAATGAGVASIPLLPELTDAWDPSGMKLSAKLHGTTQEIRQKIIYTLKSEQKARTHALAAAQALYDGYNSGHMVIRRQEVPMYLQRIIDFTRRASLTDAEMSDLRRLVRIARRNTERLGGNGAPTKALKTAYKQLLDAVEEDGQKSLEKAVRVAVEEKSRYVAERIARTEAARAWSDGFHARYDTDELVAAYKWTLSSRHPFFDICNMYADANLWGLGPGVYPKDKTPILPAHPHCLCHLAMVYRTEINIGKRHDREQQGGNDWLQSLSHQQCCQVLGVTGAMEWKHKKIDWRKYMRNYTPLFDTSRLHDFFDNVLPLYDKAVITDDKIFKYLLDPDSTGGRNKAIVFQSALGYNKENGRQLINDIIENIPKYKAISESDNGYGPRYAVIMKLKGPNGKEQNVLTAWIMRNDENHPRLSTAYVTDKEAIVI
jgi:hypothetical protein